MTQKLEAAIAIGVVTAAHGIKGGVKIKTFTANPTNIADYGTVFTADGRGFAISIDRTSNGVVIASLSGVADRTTAEALAAGKTTLYIPRHQLPADDEAWYHADLLGAVIYDQTDKAIGEAVAFHDFGGGELVEVALYNSNSDNNDNKHKTAMLPFSSEARLAIDPTAKRIQLAIDPIWLAGGGG